MARNEPLWRLQRLAELAERALAEDYEGSPDGRIREVPDPRTIRYYTTIGLIDRPAELRGRTAYYGRRHLLQLVAIKRLQAQGLPIVRVQEELAGLPTAALARIARVPPKVIEAAADEPAPPSPPRPVAFWKAEPAPVAVLQGIPLGEGATLLAALRPGKLSQEDLNAIRAAAAPLLEMLETRGLIRQTQGRLT
ncbi:MAG TPA: MerR family transcriptional regulator [Planctomycetota bacterium]|nr:MerR family transcriptional regulator [Planctomycetota bacterium]